MELTRTKIKMDKKRKDFIELGFRLFSENTIEKVNMTEIAEASDYGMATLYRYFDKKPGFVVAVATWKWERYKEEIAKQREKLKFDDKTAAEILDFYLGSFLTLYKQHKDLLRFNQNFNVYIKTCNISKDVMKPYLEIIDDLKKRFHKMYEKAKKDKTVRTDISEEEMFSTSLHLMLAAVTRYSVGLVYVPKKGFNDMKELTKLKDMLYREYTEK